MAVRNNSKEDMALGFSLHLRAEEVIAKFEKEIEDDFNYLHEILAEAKQHFGRRDSNILLPKTPSMKRKRQESDEEQSSDDSVLKITREIKAPKTQGYSPLTVIDEDELLDCSSITDKDTKQVGDKRKTRTTRAVAQAKRQQPKRGSNKKMAVANEKQTDSSSKGEKPRIVSRNARKKIEENEASSSNDENKVPKRPMRNTRKKLKDAAEISSTEGLPSQPVIKESSSNRTKNLQESIEVVPAVILKREPVSPVKEMQTLRRSCIRDSNSGKEEDKELEIITPVPETPDPAANVTKSPPTSAKTCRATVHLVLQSPGFNFGNENGENAELTSSPCVEQDLHACESTVDNILISEKNDTADGDVVNECSLLPSSPQESSKTCNNELLKSETKKDHDVTEREKHIENVLNSEKNPDATEKITSEMDNDVNKESKIETGMKSGRRSTQRSSGWRRKSKRSSQCFSPEKRRLSVKKTTKLKPPGKKSLSKSSVKLKLTQSNLMPELKLNGSAQITKNKTLEPDLEDVRVRLFDNLTSEDSTSTRSATSQSSCSSTEDKADAPTEKLVEELAADDHDDALEVFHDCRASDEDEDEDEDDEQKAKEQQHANSDSGNSPAVENMTSPVASHDTSGSEECETASGEKTEEFKTPPQEKQETANPPQKARPNNIALVHSFIRRNTPKKVDPEEKKKQLRIALKEKEVKEKERREQLEMQKQREIEERKRRREERAKKAANQRAAKLQAFEEKKRHAEDQRQLIEEKAKKLKEKEDEEKKKQRLQKRAELEARRRQEEAARQQRKREQEEEEKRQREALQRRQELEEQERQRKIAEAKRHQEHREKELERERELEKQRKLRAIEEKEKRLREKEEKERKSREEKQRIEREREEKERARIAQLIREKEDAVRREREQRAKEEKERQEREKRLREERDAALREKRRLEEMERERIRVHEARKLAAEKQTSCDSYEMTPPPARIKRQPSSQENYNIEDLNSEDSTDDEDNPRKKIPAWARPPALTAAIFKQEYSNIDVNSIFDNVPAPKLEEIFMKNRQRYIHRTSSAIWNSPPLRPLKQGTFV